MAGRAAGPKTATIFGGTGFIGRYIVRDLARRGWRIFVASRDPEAAGFLRPLGSVGQIAPVFADIREDALVRAAVRDADAVVNLVGILHEGRGRSFAGIHHEAAGRVAEAAAAAGVERLVHISALGASADSASLYARTKAAGEAAVRAAFAGATILRPSVVFGPEDGFFNRFAGLARFLPALPLFGGGRTRFQPVYVGDVAEAVARCLERPEAAGRTFELGGPKIYTFREVMRLTLDQIGRRRALVTVPWPVARLQARVLGALPEPPLTTDQLVQLQIDNVVAPGAAGLADLGIEPTAAEAILPTYLDRFRPGGRFARTRGEG